MTLEEVLLTIREPDRTEPSVRGRRNAFKQLWPDKAIRVSYLEQRDSILVITMVRRLDGIDPMRRCPP